jgi:hypothetical protein
LNKLVQNNKIFFLNFISILALKLIVLFYFFQSNSNLGFYKTFGIAIEGGDTFSYFIPIQNYLSGTEYGPPCRMPGFLPFYFFINLFTKSKTIIYSFIIICQILFSSLAITFILDFLKTRIKVKPLILFSLIVFALNTFVGIWDIILMADSFASSFFVIVVFILIKFPERNYIYLVSGLLVIGSVFFRPINIVLIPIIIMFLFFRDFNKSNIINISIFLFPTVLFMSCWIYRNYNQSGKFIPFTQFTGCYTSFNEQYYKMIKVPAALGLDFVWGGDGEYFIKEKGKLNEKLLNEITTPEFNINRIQKFRQDYLLSFKDSFAFKKDEVINEIELYLNSYKKNKPFQYYILNPAKLTLKFLFPKRLDNLILPPREKMNAFQFILKSGYYIFLLVGNLFFVLFVFIKCIDWIKIYLRKKEKPDSILLLMILIPIAFVLSHTVLMGFIEQRYLAGTYLFILISAVLFIDQILVKIKTFSKK